MSSAEIGRNLPLDIDGGVLSYDFFVPDTTGSSSTLSSLSGGTEWPHRHRTSSRSFATEKRG